MRNNCLFQELSKFKYAKSDRYEILIFVDSPTTFIITSQEDPLQKRSVGGGMNCDIFNIF